MSLMGLGNYKQRHAHYGDMRRNLGVNKNESKKINKKLAGKKLPNLKF